MFAYVNIVLGRSRRDRRLNAASFPSGWLGEPALPGIVQLQSPATHPAFASQVP